MQWGQLMHSMPAPHRLTRVLAGDDSEVEVAQLQWVMRRIQQALRDVPAAQREYIAAALLSQALPVALSRVKSVGG